VRKVQALYKFDCLRANKSTMAWGVEARVPFLDRNFLDIAMAIDPAEKMIDKANGKLPWGLQRSSSHCWHRGNGNVPRPVAHLMVKVVGLPCMFRNTSIHCPPSPRQHPVEKNFIMSSLRRSHKYIVRKAMNTP
jgi:hypothetical protein